MVVLATVVDPTGMARLILAGRWKLGDEGATTGSSIVRTCLSS